METWFPAPVGWSVWLRPRVVHTSHWLIINLPLSLKSNLASWINKGNKDAEGSTLLRHHGNVFGKMTRSYLVSLQFLKGTLLWKGEEDFGIMFIWKRKDFMHTKALKHKTVVLWPRRKQCAVFADPWPVLNASITVTVCWCCAVLLCVRVCVRFRNLRILQKGSGAARDQWQEKALCLGTSSSCGSALVGHILGFGEDQLGQ